MSKSLRKSSFIGTGRDAVEALDGEKRIGRIYRGTYRVVKNGCGSCVCARATASELSIHWMKLKLRSLGIRTAQGVRGTILLTGRLTVV